MRKFLTIAVLSLFTAFAAGEASAQARFKPNNAQGVLVPRLKATPRVQKVRPVNPKLLLIPPSRAVKIVQRTMPNAKPLNVIRDGPLYIVKLKQGGTITQVGVHAVTGAITPMP